MISTSLKGVHDLLSVLHVIARMPYAGTELQLAATLKAAHNRYWRATLCTLYPGFPLARKVAAYGIPLVEMPPEGTSHSTRLLSLRALALSEEFDVIHTSLWGASAFTRIAVLGRRRRPAVVMSERRVENFRPVAHKVVDRLLRGGTEAYIGNSNDVAEFIERAHLVSRDRVSTVGNGVDTEIFAPLQAPHRRAGNPLTVGAVGRLVHQKGFDLLIEAARQLPDREAVSFKILGSGELEPSLKHLAAGLPFEFIQATDDRRAVADFLRSLDLFVMPSRYEGLPNALLEARACGIPTVAARVPGMDFAAGTDTVFVTPEDPTALAAAIILFAKDSRSQKQQYQVRVAPPSFVDVAQQHLTVFEEAHVRRRSKVVPTAKCL